MVKLHIAKDKRTGRSRGFAYLDFDNKDSAEEAVTSLTGRPWKAVFLQFHTDVSIEQRIRLVKSSFNKYLSISECACYNATILCKLNLKHLGIQYEGRDIKIDLSAPRTGVRPVRTPSANSVFIGNLGEY